MTIGSTGGSASCSRSTPSPISFWYSRVVYREHPHRHRAVHGGLELQVQHQVQPALVVEAHAPHEVAVALPQIVADIAGRQWSQGGEVEGAAPVAGGEAVQQVLDHAWPGEQLFVRGIIHGTTPQSDPGRPSRHFPLQAYNLPRLAAGIARRMHATVVIMPWRVRFRPHPAMSDPTIDVAVVGAG